MLFMGGSRMAGTTGVRGGRFVSWADTTADKDKLWKVVFGEEGRLLNSSDAVTLHVIASDIEEAVQVSKKWLVEDIAEGLTVWSAEIVAWVVVLAPGYSIFYGEEGS
jgi:hypothetical protein